MALRVGNDTFEKEVLESGVLVAADFYSDNCVPCKRISPLLTQLEEEYSGQLKVVKININFDEQLAQRYSVQSVPTIVLFKGGEEKARLAGSISAEDLRGAGGELVG